MKKLTQEEINESLAKCEEALKRHDGGTTTAETVERECTKAVRMNDKADKGRVANRMAKSILPNVCEQR